MRVHEAIMEKKAPTKQQPYKPRKPQTRGRVPKVQLPGGIEGADSYS